MSVQTIGIDLGKTVFHLVGMDSRGEIVVKKRLSRLQLVRYTANLPACRIGMESCCGAHHIGALLTAQGHDVRLIPGQFVRPYVKSNKNDYVDAEAIAEAVQRPTMRFVPIKTKDQLDLQAIHRVRDRLITRRTSVINQLRAFLLERGITVGQGRAVLRRQMPDLLAHADQSLSPCMQRLLQQLWREWLDLESQITATTKEIDAVVAQDAACQRLLDVPGVGPLVATAMVAAIGNGSAFARGRDFAAWLGLVPRQSSTGGKARLLGISKRGNPYLRRLFVHGARSVLRNANREHHPLTQWISSLESRAHPNVVTVGLANKLARIAWAVLATGTPYRVAAPVAAQ